MTPFATSLAFLLVLAGAASAQFNTWAELAGSASGGGVSDSANWSEDAQVALDSKGYPIVVWEEGGNIYLKRWDGSAWVTMPGAKPGDTSASGGGVSGDSLGGNQYPVLAVDHFDRPVVGWIFDMLWGSYVIYAVRWDGADWKLLYPFEVPLLTDYLEPRPLALTLGLGDQPIIAFISKDGDWFENDIRVARWLSNQNPAGWYLLGPDDGELLDMSDGWAARPSITTDPRGNPLVAWEQSNFNDMWQSEIYVKRWAGQEWVELGGSASGGGISGSWDDWSLNPSIVASRRYAGGKTTLFVAVAWADRSPKSGQYEIWYKEWNGSDWVELDGYRPGETSAMQGGVSATPEDSRHPTLRLDSRFRPVISWSEYDGPPIEGHAVLRRWTGTEWTGLGGSDLAGGIDNTGTASPGPTVLALRPGDRYAVSWGDTAPGPEEAYLRVYDPMLMLEPFENPVMVDLGNGRQVGPGGDLSGDAVAFTARAPGDGLSLQVEILPCGWGWTSHSSGESRHVSAGSDARALVEELEPGEYRWRYRAVDEAGNASPWTEYGSDDPFKPDFVVR